MPITTQAAFRGAEGEYRRPKVKKSEVSKKRKETATASNNSNYKVNLEPKTPGGRPSTNINGRSMPTGNYNQPAEWEKRLWNKLFGKKEESTAEAIDSTSHPLAVKEESKAKKTVRGGGYKMKGNMKNRTSISNYLKGLNTRQRKDMQRRLQELGYYDGEIDGIVGKKTVSAYMKGGEEVQAEFEAQEDNRKETLKALKSRYGNKQAVRDFQNELIKSGYLDNSNGRAADGIIGSKTLQAYLDYMQEQEDLLSQAIDLENSAEAYHPPRADMYTPSYGDYNPNVGLYMDPSVMYAPVQATYAPESYNALLGEGDAYDIPIY